MKDYTMENELFVKVAQSGDVTELASKTSDLIRVRLYDKKGIARDVLDASPITWDEMQKDINNAAYKIVDLEGARQIAVTVPFTSFIPTAYIDLPQVKFPLEEVDTEEYVKNLTEIKFLQHSFSDEIELHARKGIEHREDEAFVLACDTAAATAGQALNIPAAPGQTYFYKSNFVTLKKMFPSAIDPLRADTFLMNESTWEDIQNWNTQEFNSAEGKKMTIEGMDFETLLNVKVITTLKADLVADNVIYAFAPVQNLGLMRIHEDVTVFMKKEKKELYYWFTEQIVMGIANAFGVAKITLV